jgi:hypothetical protein
LIGWVVDVGKGDGSTKTLYTLVNQPILPGGMQMPQADELLMNEMDEFK